MMKKILFLVVSIIVTALFFQGCGDANSDSKSMDQLYAENGVPVRVAEVSYQPFSAGASYDAVLSGIEESAAFSMVSDKIEKIYFKVGDYVKKDAVVMKFPTDNPTAKYYQAKVAFEHAESSFARVENLYASGGISRQERDNAKTQFEVAKADWEAVQKSVLAEAPIDGIITQIAVRESDNVQKEDMLFTVSKTKKLKAKIWVTEKDIANVNRGAGASALWQDKTLSGKVVQVDLALNRARQAFGVELEFDNPGDKVKCGVTAEIMVNTYASEKSGGD